VTTKPMDLDAIRSGGPYLDPEANWSLILALVSEVDRLRSPVLGTYTDLPWRSWTLTDDERRANLAKARRMQDQFTDPTCTEPPDRAAMSWVGVCFEYEDLLSHLGHGIELSGADDDPRGES